MPKYYAGIGARNTPDPILSKMENFAKALNDLGYHLRSGGAKGADSAFERATPYTCREIFTEKDATPESIQLTKYYHPNWKACNELMKRFHGRNLMIILGKNLRTPVDFVVCYTWNGKESGGTGQALRIAYGNKITIYNLFHEDHEKYLESFILRERNNRERNNLKTIT